jgi:hypothetical protein
VAQPDEKKLGRVPTFCRIGSSFALVVAAWLWVFQSANLATLFLALGMTAGFGGDLFMARLIIRQNAELGGIGAFGVGHLFYIAAFFALAGQLNLNNLTAFALGWGFWLLAGALLWYMTVKRGHETTFLHWASLPYALLLASTAGVATGLGLQQPFFLLTALGAALFLFSDLLIAAQLFNKLHFPLIRDAIWLTYGPAQALITLAALAVI